jgi:hypothetical protein
VNVQRILLFCLSLTHTVHNTKTMMSSNETLLISYKNLRRDIRPTAILDTNNCCPDPNSTSQSTHFNNNTQRLLIKISQQREFETSGLGWSYEKLQNNCCPDPNSNSTSHSTNFTLPPTSKELYNGATAQQLLLHKGGIHYTDHNWIDVISILSHHHRFHTEIQEQHNLPHHLSMVACKYGFSINDLVTLIQLLIHTEANRSETEYTVLSNFLCRY